MEKKKSSFGCLGWLWFVTLNVSFWIGSAIKKSNGYKDGSPETIRTILISLGLPTALFLAIVLVKWMIDRVQLIKADKLKNDLCELDELKLMLKDRGAILHLIELLRYCGCDTELIEKNKNLLGIKRIEDEISKKRKQIAKRSANK